MKFGTLQVRENEIPLRNWSGGSAQLRTQREHWFLQNSHKLKINR